MHIHILGVCGTFMGGIAQLAQAAGHRVSGSDAQVYPPMSDQLEQAGITLSEGYLAAHLQPEPDCVVIGNALSRANEAVEHVLNRGLRYTSGPQWLYEQVLHGRWVLAVAGTHGKTSTASMLAWILEDAGLQPGFLIGGVPENFGVSARLGEGAFFVVEADEYDTAFFDKRSKFLHYHPRTVILNNLEFDHADIFDNLEAIERQFHHFLRTVPSEGRILVNAGDAHLAQTLAQGCWTPTEPFADVSGWHARLDEADGSVFDVYWGEQLQGRVQWDLLGQHNVNNALAAIGAARHAGVPAALAAQALGRFKGVKRRMQVRARVRGITVYDDFAHHPTAIRTTLAGLRANVGTQRIIAVLEPRSNTMRLGVHKDSLAQALEAADEIVLLQPPEMSWRLSDVMRPLGERLHVYERVEDIVNYLAPRLREGDHVLIMSNGGFERLHERLIMQISDI